MSEAQNVKSLVGEFISRDGNHSLKVETQQQGRNNYFILTLAPVNGATPLALVQGFNRMSGADELAQERVMLQSMVFDTFAQKIFAELKERDVTFDQASIMEAIKIRSRQSDDEYAAQKRAQLLPPPAPTPSTAAEG